MQYAIIGVGVFGRACAKELQSLGNHVLAIDIDEKLIDEIAPLVSRAVISDATSTETLAELGIGEFDGVLVAIGDDLEASLLCTLSLIKMNVANLWVKAKTDAHHQILQSLGVTNIIHPEQDMGIKIAQNMNYPIVKQYMSLGDDDYVIAISPPSSWHGVAWHDLKRQNQVTLCLVKRGKKMHDSNDDWVVAPDDKLIVAGQSLALRQLVKDSY